MWEKQYEKRVPLKTVLQREKAVSMGADVTPETREPVLTDPRAPSWGPPQAPV